MLLFCFDGWKAVKNFKRKECKKMRLNRTNKTEVKEGDVLRFYPYSGKEDYIITTIIPGAYRNSLSFTLRNVKTKQTIYCYPSSKCYGAEIIKMEDLKK